MLRFLPTRAYRPGTPGATTFLSPLSGTFNYGWDSFRYSDRRFVRNGALLLVVKRNGWIIFIRCCNWTTRCRMRSAIN